MHAIRRVSDIVVEITPAGVEKSSGASPDASAVNHFDQATQQSTLWAALWMQPAAQTAP